MVEGIIEINAFLSVLAGVRLHPIGNPFEVISSGRGSNAGHQGGQEVLPGGQIFGGLSAGPQKSAIFAFCYF